MSKNAPALVVVPILESTQQALSRRNQVFRAIVGLATRIHQGRQNLPGRDLCWGDALRQGVKPDAGRRSYRNRSTGTSSPQSDSGPVGLACFGCVPRANLTIRFSLAPSRFLRCQKFDLIA